jgi:hypothetical protein
MNDSLPDFDNVICFEGFPKMARLNREIVITEKIDGTNAQVYITEDGKHAVAGSRSRFITPENDNYGFARWVAENHDELLKLGPGRHFGEWWGAGIQRRYDQTKKHFSLFNTHRWTTVEVPPACCRVVPVLYTGAFSTGSIEDAAHNLRVSGSMAAPGFMKPEGIVIYHTAAQTLFKVTLENDATPKSLV